MVKLSSTLHVRFPQNGWATLADAKRLSLVGGHISDKLKGESREYHIPLTVFDYVSAGTLRPCRSHGGGAV